MELFTQIELNNLEPTSSDSIISKEAINAFDRCEIVDLFCGVGGLTHGFIKESFKVKAGIDNDGSCKYAYEINNDSTPFADRPVPDSYAPGIQTAARKNGVPGQRPFPAA